MNERIRELAKQANIEIEFDDYGEIRLCTAHGLSLEKFTELIVRDCIAQIQPMWEQVKKFGPPPGYDHDTFDLAYNDSMNAIAERFGIER